MTVEQLQKANEIQNEIEMLNKVFMMLDSTITYEEKSDRPFVRFIRFINDKLGWNEECKAHVILFQNSEIRGHDIPVDLDFCKCLRSYFQDRLNEKKRELDDI